MTHELKILPQYFKEVKNGNKTFEIRKNDRNFQVGDIVRLQEYDPELCYTGNEIKVEITFIFVEGSFLDKMLQDGYCVFSFKKLQQEEKVESMESKVFISYNFITTDGLYGFGCTTKMLKEDCKIEDMDDVLEIMEDIKIDNPKFKDVSIINMQRLPI